MEALSIELLYEVIELYEDDHCRGIDGAIDTQLDHFTIFVLENLPPDVIAYLQEVFGCGGDDESGSASMSFLEDLYIEKIVTKYKRRSDDLDEGEVLAEGCCLICERQLRLTSHHVFPRSTHHLLLKRGIKTEQELATTIRICQQCHKMIHKTFTNNRLASDFYSVELLLSDEKFFKYAKWASKLHDNRTKLVR